MHKSSRPHCQKYDIKALELELKRDIVILKARCDIDVTQWFAGAAGAKIALIITLLKLLYL